MATAALGRCGATPSRLRNWRAGARPPSRGRLGLRGMGRAWAYRMFAFGEYRPQIQVSEVTEGTALQYSGPKLLESNPLRSNGPSGAAPNVVLQTRVSSCNIAAMWVKPRETVRARYLIPGLIVLVFVLGLHAKLSQYHPPDPGSINPVAASKLWVNGEKLDMVVWTAVPVLWLAAAFMACPPIRRVFRSRVAEHTPAPRYLSMFELFRLLLPPPAF